jgi:CubicO group peptidase (beta-lactamase class C family)
MRLINYLASITLLLSILAGASFAQGVTGTKSITLDKDAFNKSLTGAVGPKVKGYQYVLIKGGQVVTEKADGEAQTSADGSVKMTVNTPTNIGSLAKFLSGTAMLNMLENPTPYSLDKGKTLSQRLDRKMSTLFPDVWKNNMRPGIENITLRQVLQHRTGFDDEKTGDRSVLGFLRDANGFLPAQFDKRDYTNVNFAFNGYLLPLYARPGRAEDINTQLSTKKLGVVEADQFARNMLGSFMHTAMKTRIWDKMSPTILPNCNAANTIKSTAAHSYTSKTDAAKGFIMSAIDNDGHCLGHGGYYMSARDFANYVAHFAATDLIVSKEARDLMGTEGMASNDRLVWTESHKDQWIFDKFKMPNVFWSNGITGGYRTVLLRLPQGHYLVLFTNSPDMDVFQLRDAGVAAFRAGTQHNF